MHEQNQSGEGGGLKESVFAKARKGALPFFIILWLLFMGVAAYFYSQTVSLRNNDPRTITQEKIQKLVSDISRHMMLPVGETPTVAIISDLAALEAQPFFANAKVGDMLLVYEQARKAIIYSPNQDKIVEVGPVTPAAPPAEKK